MMGYYKYYTVSIHDKRSLHSLYTLGIQNSWNTYPDLNAEKRFISFIEKYIAQKLDF